jgi:hypothetical protein
MGRSAKRRRRQIGIAKPPKEVSRKRRTRSEEGDVLAVSVQAIKPLADLCPFPERPDLPGRVADGGVPLNRT